MLVEIFAIRGAEEKAAVLRAGLVAAAVYNVSRKKGARFIQATDFLPVPMQEELPLEQLRAGMDAWARSINRRHRA